MRRFLLILGVILAVAGQARAHALDPGYLEVTALEGDTVRAFFRSPDVQGAPMAISAQLPENCADRSGPAPSSDGRGWSAAWITACPGGLAGGWISIDGLEKTRTDVLVRAIFDGTATSIRLTPDATTALLPVDPGAWDVMASYVPLGIDHILGGLDHLLFVFALLLLIPDAWRLVGAITAFTIAHSITMGAATLGWIALPGPPVEAVIALSIMFLASELLRRRAGNMLLSERYPWIVSFSFGLLHGFGFAGALREIGLPQNDVPLALLSFNIGVEAGQLMFVAAILLIGWILARMVPGFIDGLRTPGRIPATIAAYAIGGLSAFWLIERISGFA